METYPAVLLGKRAERSMVAAVVEEALTERSLLTD